MGVKIAKFLRSLTADPYKVLTLKTKEHINDTIYQDADTRSFSVYTYSPATFTQDYDYLLLWKGKERKASNLRKNGTEEFVYLIIHWTTKI